MKKLILGLTVSAIISVATAADGSGPTAGTTVAPMSAAATTTSAPAPATAVSKEIDPVKAAMGDGACCTDGSCDVTEVRKVFLSPRAAQLAGKPIRS